VRFAEGLGIGLEDLSPEQLQEIDSRLGSDLIESLSAQGAISTRTSIMSTGPKALSRQIADLESSLQAVQLTFTNHESTFNKAIYSII
jgi:argininosuccinate lyase